MAKEGDRVAQIRQRVERLADSDTRTARVLSRFADYSRDELERFLRFPPEAFPMHGFQTKGDCRTAWYGTFPKKEWPAALQAMAERVAYVMRREKPDNGRPINLRVMAINIPARAAIPAASQDVLTFRRTKKGSLRRVMDVNPVAGALPPPEEEDEEGGE